MVSATEKPKIIVICGPTGIGKTAVGIELAEKLGGEIISADSMQIYRYMDIGTAKPTAAEQGRVRHHMIDIVDPDEDFDAVGFARIAREKVMKLHQKGVCPVVAGGTGLYIKALLQGLFQTPPANPEIRERLNQEAAESGSSHLHGRLKQVDPETAARLHPNDTYRIIRALETIETTGKSISEHHQDHGFKDEPFDALKIGLQMDRQKLYDRIDRRVDLMIEAGFVDELKNLLRFAVAPRHVEGRPELIAGTESFWIDMPAIDLASTEIRRQLLIGETAAIDVPESVRNFIIKNKLYQEDSVHG